MDHGEILLYLLLDLVIVIAAARSFGWAARRVGQPAVVGEIMAGIILGPTILGRIDADLPGEIFPAEVPLRQIADLGLVFFMFLVGLELDTKMVRAQGRRALQISLSGIVLPLIGGIALGYFLVDVNLGGEFLEGTDFPPDDFSFALFLGAAMCITAFPVLARILVETGLYKTPVGAATLCAAAVDDVCAWILLAAVVGLVQTGSVAEAGEVFALTFVFIVFMVTVGRWLLSRLAARYDATGHLTIDMVAAVIGGVLLAALATEEIGIHSIFGAFIFGAIMPSRAGMTRELTDKIEDFTVIVLLPVFFLVAGLRTNLFTLDSPSLIAYLLLIIAVAIVGKFAGCGLAARLTGASWRDSVIIGSLMNTRGLTELVILSIGLSLGVLSDRLFAMMVIMALVTTLIAAPIVNRMMPRERLLREIAEAEGEPQVPVASRILVALGNPANAGYLVDAAIRMMGSRRPAELLLVRLIPTPRAPEFRTGLLDEESQVDAAVESMRHFVEHAEAAGVKARPLSFLSPDVGRDLARVAGEQSCDAMLLGWHRASLEQGVVTALVHRAFRLAPCDVAVFVDRVGMGVQHVEGRAVLTVLSGGKHDGAAALIGTHIASSLSTSMRLAGYVSAADEVRGDGDSEKLALQADSLRSLSGVWVVPEVLSTDGDAIAAAVVGSTEASVAVVGVGDEWSTDAAFGQPASRLSEELSCPVLVVRAAGEIPPETGNLLSKLGLGSGSKVASA
ncbi:MAG: hypothetical protein GEU28_02205 [Dehalococcoidia bacterium]|nr:hypothetical protein [Dehalococcoidia bacterium]